AGATIGVATGTAVELAVIMLVGLLVLVAIGPPRVTRTAAIAGGVAAFATALIVWVFLVVRAQQHPDLNWGEVDSVARLVDLVRHSEYAGGGTETSFPIRVVSYPTSIARDLGLGAILLAGVGVWAAWKRLDRARQWFLVVVGTVNLVAVIAATGLGKTTGFAT